MQNVEDISQEPENGRKSQQVRSRDESFVDKTATNIWCEIPSPDNPYVASQCLLHGYDIVELMDRSFADVFYLLFKGELPSAEKSQILQALMVSLINPGPRHAATRAAQNAGVSKAHPPHLLPVSIALLGGDYAGGGEIAPAMRFIAKNLKNDPVELAGKSTATGPEAEPTGFGLRHGGVEHMATAIAEKMVLMPGAGEALKFSVAYSAALAKKGAPAGLLITGLAAAVFVDLGFHPKAGCSLFQLLGAPGLAAHGIEMTGKSIHAMPFVKDEDYFLDFKPSN